MTTDTIMVADSRGEKTIEARVLAYFRSLPIQGATYALAVTEARDCSKRKITHVASGMSLGIVEIEHGVKAAYDWAIAGHWALLDVIETNGEARVASALRTLEY